MRVIKISVDVKHTIEMPGRIPAAAPTSSVAGNGHSALSITLNGRRFVLSAPTADRDYLVANAPALIRSAGTPLAAEIAASVTAV